MIGYAALSPHPPLIIPVIGGSSLEDVKATVSGMKEMARELVDSKPDSLVFLTPHGNVFADCLSALSEEELQGDFRNFGSKLGTSRRNDKVLLDEIETGARKAGISFITLSAETLRLHHLNPRLDHGILVPLHYLEEAGLPQIPILAISVGFLSPLELYTFGVVIRDAALAQGKKLAVVASGDMSHRLKNEGPYDYHPDGAVFDQQVQQILRAGDSEALIKMPEKLRNNAGECGYASLLIALGSLDGSIYESKIFSYEGPFGVGYLCAGLRPKASTPSRLEKLVKERKESINTSRNEESTPVRWARMILESYIREGKRAKLPPEMEELRQQRAGVFVSLEKNGQLRGCIGTIAPSYGDLADEIAGNAISAGTADPRFLPVDENELDDLVYSVDILGDAEACRIEDLDPHQYGVIVSSGRKRGLLLPDLEGVDSVEEQLSIALQKAGISPGERYEIERFEVKRYY